MATADPEPVSGRTGPPSGRVPEVSVIVPALDEGSMIATTLTPLQRLRQSGRIEVIVVDGGSRDDTRTVAAALADRVVASAPGRAVQQNAGAAVAGGDTLLFLHADTVLPAGWIDAIGEGLAAGRSAWGRFDVTIAGSAHILPVVATLMNWRSRLTGIATGDQGIFVRRAVFDTAGGFPVQRLMEDIAFSRRLKSTVGRPLCLRSRVRTSGRRWDAHGPWRTILLMWQLRLRYYLGADPDRLARAYRR